MATSTHGLPESPQISTGISQKIMEIISVYWAVCIYPNPKQQQINKEINYLNLSGKFVELWFNQNQWHKYILLHIYVDNNNNNFRDCAKRRWLAGNSFRNEALLVKLLIFIVDVVSIQVLAHVNRPHSFPLPGLWGIWVRLEVWVLVGLIKRVPWRLWNRFVWLIEWIRRVVVVTGIQLPRAWLSWCLCSTERTGLMLAQWKQL